MNFSENGRNILKSLENPEREGFEAELNKWYQYKDNLGDYNIAWGHNLPKISITKYPLGITEEEANDILDADVTPIEEMLNENIPFGFQGYNQNEFDALVIFVYNIGITAFINSHVYGFIKEGQHENACKYWAQWCHDRDPITHEEVICEGLVKRRQAEIELFTLEGK